MKRHEIILLKKKLQDGGVARKYIRRLIREITDHREDLILAALNRGANKEEASQEASSKLGHYKHVADDMLARREFRSLGSRYPISVLLILPVVSFILLAVLSLFAFIALMSTFFASDQIVEISPLHALIPQAYRIFVMYLLGPALGLLVLFYAIRNHLSLRLAAIGTLLLVAFASSVIIRINFPDPAMGTQGSLGASVGYYLYNSREYLFFAQRLFGSLLLLAGATWAYSRFHDASEFES